MTDDRAVIVGIDLHNIRDGGGMNYIRNLLGSADPDLDGFRHIHLFGAAAVLDTLPDRAWITRHAHAALGGSLLSRLRFVARRLPALWRAAGCTVLYAPGGIAFGNIRPYVTISRNMLPFQPQFWRMYRPFSSERLRLRLLRWLNARTFAVADGMIFLSQTARTVISAALPRQPVRTAVVPHGVDHEVFTPQPGVHPAAGSIKLVYPSRLEPYKHQLEVIAAFRAIAAEFPQASLTLCGPANPAYHQAVLEAIGQDPSIHYLGEYPSASLPTLYAQSSLLIFASSCENLPNILIEAMACGVPICCSDRSPMPEIAGDACLYFDPERPDQVAAAIRAALRDGEATRRRVEEGLRLARQYSWPTAARRTFALIRDVALAAPPSAT